MARQFLRSVRVVISKPTGGEGVQIGEGFRIAFEVHKKDGSSANECKVRIYNLSKDTIEKIRQKNAVIQLYAGYGEVVPLLYKGIVTRVTVEPDNADVICDIESKRGFLSIPQRDPLAPLARAAQSYIKRTFTAQTSLLDGLRAVVGDVREILGDYASQIAADLQKVPAGPARQPRALTLSGTPEQVLGAYTAANNLDWWMEDGIIRVVPKGEASREQAFVLSPDSGLVGSPKPKLAGKTQTATGGVELVCLLNGELRVRRAVQVAGTRANAGWYLIRKVSHKGDSGWETDYYTTVEATPIKAQPASPSRRPVRLRQALTALGQEVSAGASALVQQLDQRRPRWATYGEARAEVLGWYADGGLTGVNVVFIYQEESGRYTTAPASVVASTTPTYPIRRPS